MFRHSAFLILILLSTNVFSEVYQWKDEFGNIHFSDKKPEQAISADRVEIKENKGRFEYKAVEAKKPIYNFGRKPYQKGEKVVVIDTPVIKLDKKGHRKTPVGEAFFGGNCVSPTTMYIEDLADSYQFLVSEGYNGLDTAIADEMERSNYSRRTARSGFAKHEATKLGGYLLETEINELIIRSCYFNTRLKHVYRFRNDLKKIKWRNSTVSKAYVNVRWKLKDVSDGRILYAGESEGSFDHWTDYIDKHISHSILQTVKKATQLATQNLLSDERFVALIRTQSSNTVKTKRHAADSIHSLTDMPASKDAPVSRGFIGNAMDTAKLTAVMSVMSSLKISTTEYYMMNGRFPERLSDIHIDNPDEFTDQELVKYYSIEQGGIIAARLANRFGKNAKLVFIPKALNQIGLIEWSCRGNLHKSVLARLNCKSF